MSEPLYPTELKIRAILDPASESMKFYFRCREARRPNDIVQPYRGKIVWEPIENIGEDYRPGLSIPMRFNGEDWAQILMNDLWAAGYRPSAMPVDGPKVVEAKQAHIDSLEQILKTVLPAAVQSRE